MNKEYWFEMCRQAQRNYLETQGTDEYRSWKILEQKIEDSGWMEEYQEWYKAEQDMAVAEWNTEELRKQQEARGKTNVQESN